MMAGVNLIHVPYRSAGPALTDLLGGQVQVMFDNMASSIEHIRAGKLRPLAVTTTMRSETLPDVPTVSEFVPGYEVSNWFGVGAPKATPAEILDRLNKEINSVLDDPKIKARLADLGGKPVVCSPAGVMQSATNTAAAPTRTLLVERLRPCRAEDKRIRGEASAKGRAGGGLPRAAAARGARGGAPAPLKKSRAGNRGQREWGRC
jgi:hypothetical protein